VKQVPLAGEADSAGPGMLRQLCAELSRAAGHEVGPADIMHLLQIGAVIAPNDLLSLIQLSAKAAPTRSQCRWCRELHWSSEAVCPHCKHQTFTPRSECMCEPCQARRTFRLVK
jgi:hypothetical protein